MNHDKPKYLAELPKERPGHYIIIGIAAVLAISIIGAWKIYVGTVSGWENRFNPPADRAPVATTDATATNTAGLPEQRVRDLAEARARTADIKVDRCIDGVAFRKLPGGGWENLPGIPCR